METKRTQKIKGVVVIIVIATILLLSFFKQPHLYSAKILGMTNENQIKEEFGEIKVVRRAITFEKLASLIGRTAIPYSSEIIISRQKIAR